MGHSKSRSCSSMLRKRLRSKRRNKQRSKSRNRSLSRNREGLRNAGDGLRKKSRLHSCEQDKKLRSQSPLTPSAKSKISENVSEADLKGKSPEQVDMMKTIGFCVFETTKGKKVEGNNKGEVHVILKRKYRQYMNRRGGFNRPLDFVV